MCPFRADLYGTITSTSIHFPLVVVGYATEFKDRRLSQPYACADSLLYVADRDSFYVHYLNGDSLRIRPLRVAQRAKDRSLDAVFALGRVREQAKQEPSSHTTTGGLNPR